MGEDFIRHVKDSYHRSRQLRLKRATSIRSLFDACEPPDTAYPCLSSYPTHTATVGQTVALYIDGDNVSVLEGHLVVGHVCPDQIDSLAAEMNVRSGLKGYVPARITDVFPNANRFDVVPDFQTGAGEL
jgi:hypothetical protein